jgi:fucose permease
VLSIVLLAALLVTSTRLPLRTGARAAAAQTQTTMAIPSRFWLYAAFAVLYGICETMNGNWSQLDMTTELGASTTVASLALTTFWAMVTVGRVLFAAIQRWFPTHRTYHLLPIVLAGAFVLIASLSGDSPAAGVAAFGLAGLACSALLPLTISFGQKELASVSTAVAGGVIAFYQLGYGIAAFGVGPLLDGGVELPTIYGFAALVAVAMGLWSFVVARRRPAPTSVRPVPG